MKDASPEAFANREEPIPIIAPLPTDDESSATESHDQKAAGKVRAKAENVKEKLRDAGTQHKDDRGSLQDRLFARLLQQVIPAEDLDHAPDGKSDARSTRNVNRPGFSLPLMTSNFRRFNARIGIVFVFQHRMIRLLSWRVPTHTLSFLAVYSFICLDPHLLTVLPLIVVLLFIMVPSFIVRHPPPPSRLSTDAYSADGPAMAPPPNVKPVTEMSKDFFRNLRDLQNSMEDFAEAHDQVVNFIAPPTNFSDEVLSSGLFLLLTASACFLFLASHLLPWRLLFLVTGWFATCLGHPSVQRSFVSVHKDHLRPRERAAQNRLTSWIDQDIILDSPPQVREVEIFELQRRTGSVGEWEGWVFSPSPYNPLSRERVAGERPSGTRFFEDVQAPAGWTWSDKKWTLDLLSREWVEERMITGVEVETEGQRWVYDIQYDDDADEDDEAEGAESEKKAKGPSVKRRDWEEGTGKERQGQWRRRRWARLVQRSSEMKGQDGNG